MKSQSTSKKSIGQYLRRWLGWSILASVGGSAIAAPGDSVVDLGAGCTLTPFAGGTTALWPFTSGSAPASGLRTIFDSGPQTASSFVSSATVYFYDTYSLLPPSLTTTSPTTNTTLSEPIIAPGSTTTVYMTLGATPANGTCSYTYTLTSDATGNLTRSNVAYYALLPPAPSNPTAVPIFTPIGLVATIGGLLWFGRRRKAKVTTD